MANRFNMRVVYYNKIKCGRNFIMSDFFAINEKALAEYARVSCEVGAKADYVQGGGGNTSVKLENGLMAIKASGYCLKDIRPNEAYAVLSYDELQKFYYGHEIADFEDVEKAGSAKAKEVVVNVEGMPALRPSVEAGFHSILDTYVAHSHSVYANLAACSNECTAIVAKAMEGADYSWGYVPYTDPGAKLTFSIRDEIARVEKETGKRPAAIFMQNHGLIAHADDPDECLRVHYDVNERIARAFGLTGESFPACSVKDLGDGLCEADAPYLAQQLTSGAYDEKFFLETPLYPDQMVFLIGAFNFGSGKPEEGCCLADPATGRVVFNMPQAKAQVLTETLTAVTWIRTSILASGYTLSTMGEAAKHFIANWESEKYRKSLAGKK